MLHLRNDSVIMREPNSRFSYRRTKSITLKRIPLQEAMKNGNSTAYFNALRRLDLKMATTKMEPDVKFKFLCMHLTAATREVRPDLVRILFHQVMISLAAERLVQSFYG